MFVKIAAFHAFLSECELVCEVCVKVSDLHTYLLHAVTVTDCYGLIFS